MALRPAWQGHLKLSLVTCPVALYAGTSEASGVSFNLLNPETGNRIKMVCTDPETGPVERSSLVRGFAIDKNLYVTVTDEEIKSVRLESTKTIAVERFVPEADIDRLYWDAPYFVAPDGAMAVEAFSVIREAMREEGQVALGRVVMSTRERLLALEPRGRGIVAHTLRTQAETRNPEEVFQQIPDVAVDPAMVAIAKQIVQQHEAPFDPSQFTDRYADALRALIEEKRQGAPLTSGSVSGPPEHQVRDLMEALKRSLAGGAAPTRRKRPAAAEPSAKPNPARPRRRA